MLLRLGKSQITAFLFLIVSSSIAFGYTAPTTSTTNTPKLSNSIRDSSFIPVVNIPWLIVGGGIHGVHISVRLIGNNVVNSSDICIIDSNDALLQNWKCRTRNSGMEYLRSSAGYHLDIGEDSLRSFSSREDMAGMGNKLIKNAGKKNKRKRKKPQKQKKDQYFSTDYERPRLDFFNEHCDSVISKYSLDQIHIKGIVEKIIPFHDFVEVHVSFKDSEKEKLIYRANQIVLALGNDEPSYVEWVEETDIKNGFVRHLLDTSDGHNNARILNDDKSSIAIVGGGITAAHKALELSRKEFTKRRTIHLISRHPLKEQQFDTHQHWMIDKAASKRSKDGGGYGLPERQVKFQNCKCWKERRSIISNERKSGTVTPAVNRGKDGLKYAIEKGDIEWHQSDIVQKTYIHEDNVISKIELTLSSGEKIQADQVLLATGFGKSLPGGELIQDMIKSGLDVSEFCGYPIIDNNLNWGNHIYVAGALAELELGPSARNIAGARLAAERIVGAFL